MFKDVVDAISTVGFPIVCCGFMYVQNTKVIEKLRNTLDKNTVALVKVLEKLGVESDEDE